MKLFFSEHLPHYESYSFPYQVWGLQEPNDDRNDLLSRGFLPSRMKIGLWYLARSFRIDLTKFIASSENRRVIKKTIPYHFTIQSSSTYKISNSELLWMRQYIIDTIGEVAISDHAIKRIFSPHLSNPVFMWRKQDDDRIAGMVPVMVLKGSMFYWMAFLNPAMNASGLGSRMMLEAIQWAQKDGLAHAYLGTVYKPSALYKTNFSGGEFFDGARWNSSMEALSYLVEKHDGPDLFRDNTWLELAGVSTMSEYLKVLALSEGRQDQAGQTVDSQEN